MHPQDVVLVDSDMRVTAKKVRQSNDDTAIGDATVAWKLMSMARVEIASGSAALRSGATNDYDGAIDLSTLDDLIVGQKYILQTTAVKTGRTRTIEKVVVARRGFQSP